ncbi:MAG: GlsB/YeaQ/YmgE family stress response membrane protein, partial [Gemmatimonadales bacterium]|nr:GlsB/YeaQ/YmgE family stress response membrane protein [Gemmatimonadales bacterium]
MGIIAWIILGAVAGWLAAVATGRRQGCLVSILVGIGGAMIGGLIFSFLGGIGITGLNLWSLIVAFIGAIILL